MIAAIYARCSTKMQSTDLQLDVLRDYCKSRGLETIEYIDEGVSGAKKSRPALDRLMADAFKRKFQVVVVARFDRFARSVTHLSESLELFNNYGISFVSVSQQIDTSTAAGKLVYHVLAAVAEMERELIRERVTSGVRRAMEKRTSWGRKPVSVDLDTVKGLTVRKAAEILGVSRETVRRLRSRNALLGLLGK